MSAEAVFSHPTALVETDEVGAGTRVWDFAHILEGATVGRNCNIGSHCFVEGGVDIGDGVTIKNHTYVCEGVSIGNGAFVGPHTSFLNDFYPRSPRSELAGDRYEKKSNWLVRTTVEEGASLGGGSVVLPGVAVGRFAMVGAGSVVTRSVPPYALVMGNPATLKGFVCHCGHPLGFETKSAICPACASRFVREGELVRRSD